MNSCYGSGQREDPTGHEDNPGSGGRQGPQEDDGELPGHGMGAVERLRAQATRVPSHGSEGEAGEVHHARSRGPLRPDQLRDPSAARGSEHLQGVSQGEGRGPASRLCGESCREDVHRALAGFKKAGIEVLMSGRLEGIEFYYLYNQLKI